MLYPLLPAVRGGATIPELEHGLDYLAVEELVVGRTPDYRSLAEKVEEPIEQTGRKPLEPAHTVGLNPHHLHHLGPASPCLEHSRQEFRRVLECGLMAKIASEPDQSHGRILQP